METVAPHAGAWIETLRHGQHGRNSQSRLTQARGLKLAAGTKRAGLAVSRLTQERGLKQQFQDQFQLQFDVAPHAGAWIETMCRRRTWGPIHVAPHAGAWIETRCRRRTWGPIHVAPHAGAWIETKKWRV